MRRKWLAGALVIGIVSLPMNEALFKRLGGAYRGDPETLRDSLSAPAQQLLAQVFADVTHAELRDYHVHLVGLGVGGTGAQVNPKMLNWFRPVHRIKARVYLSGAGVTDERAADQQYVERLVRLVRAMDKPGLFHLLAFDHHYNADGSVNREKSEFYTPNEYVFALARKYPELFRPVASVHPYRDDALSELEKWARQGARLVKWLPNAHGIDASDPRLDPYYDLLKRYDMALLTHVGEEQAVEAKEDQALGNPLRFRRALDRGVKVVMAHAASLGQSRDLDGDGSLTDNFDLFLRLMDEPQYEGLLFGEISAMTQFNRLPRPLIELLRREDLHHRLVNGSDYPLPALNVVIWTRALVRHGLITKQQRKLLNEIYDHNPLLFDYAVKRTLRAPGGQRFAARVFQAHPALEARMPSQARDDRRPET